MLDVLVRRGYVGRRADGAYEPTLRLFELAHRQSPVRRLTETALPVMERLSRSIGQSTHLAVHYDRRILVVGQVESPEPMGFSVRLGSHYPFGADRGSAFVLTAFQPREAQDVLMSEMITNSRGRLTRRGLLAELAKVSERGYFQGPSRVIIGVIQLSFPLFGSGQGAVAALASPYLKQRDVKVSVVEARAALADAAREISASLGAGVR
jgi:DNA-binding IclR family transcriptional regulator